MRVRAMNTDDASAAAVMFGDTSYGALGMVIDYDGGVVAVRPCEMTIWEGGVNGTELGLVVLLRRRVSVNYWKRVELPCHIVPSEGLRIVIIPLRRVKVVFHRFDFWWRTVDEDGSGSRGGRGRDLGFG